MELRFERTSREMTTMKRKRMKLTIKAIRKPLNLKLLSIKEKVCILPFIF